MTVSNENSRNEYLGTGSLDTFAYNFQIYAKTDLDVYVEGVQKTVDVDYTVTGVGNVAGGNVVFVPGQIPGSGVSVVLQLDLPLTQLVDYTEGDAFPAETHERGLDKLTKLAQQLKNIFDKTIRLPDYSIYSGQLPTDLLADYFLKVNSAGTAFELEAVVPEGTDLSPYAKLAGRAGGQRIQGDTTIDNLITKSPWVDVRAYASINAAVAAIGATQTTLIVPNAQTLTANLIIPSNIHLVILVGGSIAKASTYTLTINGPFDAGSYQVFTGFTYGVDLIIAASLEIDPVWYGSTGGRTLHGGVSSAEKLRLQSTRHATKGRIELGDGTDYYDETLKAFYLSGIRVKDPWFDVRAYGTLGTADDASVIQLAMAAAGTAGGGIVVLPVVGQINVATPITWPNHNITFQGLGAQATHIARNHASNDVFQISGKYYWRIKDVYIKQVGTPTGGWVISATKSGAVGCSFGIVEDIMIEDVWNGIQVSDGSECNIERIKMFSLDGTRGILVTGTSGMESYGFNVQNSILSNANGGNNNTLYWIVVDNYSQSIRLSKVGAIYGYVGLAMIDTAATGSSYPIWCYCEQLEIDHPSQQGISLERGEGFYLLHGWVGSSLNSHGIAIDGANFRGEVDIGESRIMGNDRHGILVTAATGAVQRDINIHDNFIGDNSAEGSNLYDGVNIGNFITNFRVINNRLGNLVGVAGNNQRYGLAISGANSEYFAVIGNDTVGNVIGGVYNASGTSATKIVANNI